VLAACLAAVAAGAAPAALATPLSSLQLPPHRVVEVGRPAGVPVVDATMAATPAKGAAALVAFPRASIVLVAGGAVESSAGPVHATAAEQELLERACADARRVARSVVLFGSAAQVLGPLLPGAMVEDDIEDAVERALTVLDGAAAVVVAPMFPVSPADRARVAEVVRRPR
jgi:UDP-N-acetylmuramoylalanine-D-glutamate ligase